MNKYEGFLVEQQPGTGTPFLVFVAGAKDIVRWAHADSIKLDRGNVQRELIAARWRQIKKFFKAHKNNVIPTSVTIAFDESVTKVKNTAALKKGVVGYVLEQDPGTGTTRVIFPDEVQPATFIIDGQHRLKGMSELDFDPMVPVCLFLSMTKLERAFQFVTINNKAHKLATDNLKALYANFDLLKGDLRDRLTHASITGSIFATAVDVLNEDQDSPFHKMVDWVNNRFEDGNPLVPPAALENSLKAVNRAFPETKSDESDALAVLYAIWKAIFAEYSITHENAGDFPNLILKATIQSLSEMVVDRIKSDFDPAFSQSAVMDDGGAEAGKKAAALISGIPAEFWTEEWTLKSLDTSGGRDIIKKDIRILKANMHANPDDATAWRKDLNVFSTGEDEDED
ncbi:DGQHR domain-containing protein [Bradyrhizobium sp. S3.3.6]|uniref:DGQHR domain-containing protein n=1 Tax=Bradyrhizobium sp. S3.3.6 TaxID=3156429 RepID=UPI003394FF6C